MSIPAKSLHQRILEYETTRARIFGEEIKLTSRKYRKIIKLREKILKIKRAKISIVETIVTTGSDNRFFARTTVGGKEILALLDSGAGACCIGRNAMEFLEGFDDKIIKLRNQVIRTANGSNVPVVGVATLPVVWEGVTREIEFLIVPGLQQEFYFGIDF